MRRYRRERALAASAADAYSFVVAFAGALTDDGGPGKGGAGAGAPDRQKRLYHLPQRRTATPDADGLSVLIEAGAAAEPHDTKRT